MRVSLASSAVGPVLCRQPCSSCRTVGWSRRARRTSICCATVRLKVPVILDVLLLLGKSWRRSSWARRPACPQTSRRGSRIHTGSRRLCSPSQSKLPSTAIGLPSSGTTRHRRCCPFPFPLGSGVGAQDALDSVLLLAGLPTSLDMHQFL